MVTSGHKLFCVPAPLRRAENQNQTGITKLPKVEVDIVLCAVWVKRSSHPCIYIYMCLLCLRHRTKCYAGPKATHNDEPNSCGTVHNAVYHANALTDIHILLCGKWEAYT